MSEFQGAATHILVVDDRPDDLVALKSTLEEPDYDIIPACSGAEALRCANEEDVSVILFIAKGLVEAHGGRIWVESKVNVGTTFYFVLLSSPHAR